MISDCMMSDDDRERADRLAEEVYNDANASERGNLLAIRVLELKAALEAAGVES